MKFNVSGLTHWTNITLMFWDLVASPSWENKLYYEYKLHTESQMSWRFVLLVGDATFTFTRIPLLGWWVNAEIEPFSEEIHLWFGLRAPTKQLIRSY